MDIDEVLFKQLEIYSSAIVGFSAIQGLGFLYYFGSNRVFNCYVKAAAYLSEALVVLFLIVGGLCVFALYKIYLYQKRLDERHSDILKSIFHAKVIASTIFYIFPAAVIWFYGVLKEAPDLCKQLIG